MESRKLVQSAVAAALLSTMLVGGSARAAGDIDIGGRTGLTLLTSLISIIPETQEATHTLLVGGTATWTTPGGRHEFAGGLTVVAIFGGGIDTQTYIPNFQYRLNSNLLGPEDNWLLFVGGTVGASFIVNPGFEQTLATFGPKFGAEYYFNRNVALQLQDIVLWDSGGTGQINNSLTIGLKVLF